MNSPDNTIVARVDRMLHRKTTSWTQIKGGYTPAERWLARGNSSAVFVKCGVTPGTADLLRREFRAYESIRGEFMPALVAWDDDGSRPILIIEDLSGAHWPPPWTENEAMRVIDCIAEMHCVRASLPQYEAVHGGRTPGWSEVAANPTAFLSLGIASADWLDEALPILTKAEEACDPSGTAVTHWDIRSDNICITPQGVKLVDWPEACLSNAKLDLGFWLPSLAYEGGPQPEAILANEPEIAAWVAGFFAACAGLPTIPNAPLVRRVQREQLSTALPWAIRALQLPEMPR